MSKLIDLTGKQFERLTVIEKVPSSGKNAMWLCECICGQRKIFRGDYLRSGQIKSCGCLRKETATNNLHLNEIKNHLAGQKFGKLTVLEETNQRENGNIIWKCKCNCGNIVYIRSHALISGHTQSCGCLTQSKGELKISELLQVNAISFETQKTFKNCIFPNTNALARFDFYVNNQYLIEYDGIQHFQDTGWGTLEITQTYDQIKNKYCLEHNIPLIRIPYYHYDLIQITDLRLETSPYLIKE